MTPEIKKLFEEHGAQDTGAFAYVHVVGAHKKVASWNNANQAWDLLPEGKAFLASFEEAAAEEVVVKDEVPAKAKGKKAAKEDAADDDFSLE